MLVWLLLGGLSLVPGARALDAQVQIPPGVSRMSAQEGEVLRRLQSSGYTADEIRQLMRRQGVSGGMGESYLQAMEGYGDPSPMDDPTALLRAIEMDRFYRDQVPEASDRSWSEERRDFRDTPEEDLGPRPFGSHLFQRAVSEFESRLAGPPPLGYRIAPGDELLLVLTGDVERVFNPMVSPEGWVVLPGVGRVPVAGSTLPQLQDELYRRFSQVYSGLTGGPEATTFLHVSLGRLRTLEVFVLGEVRRPGAHHLPPGAADPLSALYLAGGPTQEGSFRRVRVVRGGQEVGEVDVYSYLLEGRTERAIALQDGDVLFVPLAGPRVVVQGSVPREALFELRDGDGLGTVLGFAGGIRPDAHAGFLQIERYLAPEARAGGRDREVLDIPLDGKGAAVSGGDALQDGDRVTVLPAREEVGNPVAVSGAVWRPGRYGVAAGDRVSDLLARAGGVLPDAERGRVQLFSLDADRRWRMVAASLEGGGVMPDPEVSPEDRLHVVASRDLVENQVVRISGWVRNPGEYVFSRGMTLTDLVLLAGGLREGAFPDHAEISRAIRSVTRSPVLSVREYVPLPEGLLEPSPAGPSLDAQHPAVVFRLQGNDQVFIRRAPGYQAQELVTITGEVELPGEYPLEARGERLLDLLERSGGLTSEAFADGVQVWRVRDRGEFREQELQDLTLRNGADGLQSLLGGEGRQLLPSGTQRREPGDTTLEARARDGEEARQAAQEDSLRMGDEPPRPLSRDTVQMPTRRLELPDDPPRRTRVALRMEEVRQRPNEEVNLRLEAGDSIHVPTFVPTVEVRGSVEVETKVLYRPGADVEYYLRQAGGVTAEGDNGRVRVTFANGEVDVRRRMLWLFRRGPGAPDPGSVVFVPIRPPRDATGQTREVVNIATSVATAIAALLIATSR
ncbi:MAG: SLBB domain-containing protein [Gemmatimonadota bacterium]